MYHVPTIKLLKSNEYIKKESIYWYVIGIERTTNLRIKITWYYCNIELNDYFIRKIKNKTPGYKNHIILPINFRSILINFLGHKVNRLNI